MRAADAGHLTRQNSEQRDGFLVAVHLLRLIMMERANWTATVSQSALNLGSSPYCVSSDALAFSPSLLYSLLSMPRSCAQILRDVVESGRG